MFETLNGNEIAAIVRGEKLDKNSPDFVASDVSPVPESGQKKKRTSLGIKPEPQTSS